MLDPYNSTNSKSMQVYYGFAPRNIEKGKGAILYDCNQREILDCGMALGSVSLGYAYDEVDNFVINQIRNGVNFSRPSYLEEELTNILGSDFKDPSLLAKYSKSSSMLLNVIPRIARYLTEKNIVAYPMGCFLGNTDWYLSHTMSGGISPEIKNSTLTFKNGDCDSLKQMFKQNSHDLACIVMEPYREEVFSEEFYNLLYDLCLAHKVILVFDETVTGYRFDYPLAQHRIGYMAHFTILGKAFANGYSLSAAVCTRRTMKKIEDASIAGKLFDFSTTHAGESVGIAAAIQTLKIYKEQNVVDQIREKGTRLMSQMSNTLQASVLGNFISLKGHPSHFRLHSNLSHSRAKLHEDIIKFFYHKGVLFRGTVSLSLSHTEEHIDKISDIFSEYCANFNPKVIN